MATSPSRKGPIALELTPAQVDQVVRAAGEGGSISLLLNSPDGLRVALKSSDSPLLNPQGLNESRFSRSLLVGLGVFATLPPDGSPMPVTEVARIMEMSPSTTHRYAITLVLAGLAEQDAGTRGYRVARSVSGPGSA